MKLSKRNKIVLVLGFLFVLITILVAFYLKPEKENLFVEGVYSVADYEVIEGDSQKVIKSKEAGFSLSVPANWIIKEYGDKVVFSSSDIEFKQDKDIAEVIEEDDVCSGSVEIKRYSQADHPDITTLSILIKQVESGEKGQDRDYAYSLVDINGRVFLKIVFTRDDQTIYISNRTIINNIIYHINSGLFFSEQCEQDFNNILQSISIDI